VKTYGAPRSEASSPTRRGFPDTGALSRACGTGGGDATSTTIRGRTHALSRPRRALRHACRRTFLRPLFVRRGLCEGGAAGAPSRKRLATFTQGAGVEGRAFLSSRRLTGARGGTVGRRRVEGPSRVAARRARTPAHHSRTPHVTRTSIPFEGKTSSHRKMTVVLGGPRSSAFGIDTVACGARVGSLGNPPREGRDPGERSRCLSFVPSEAA
jgi:hypothetical protein